MNEKNSKEQQKTIVEHKLEMPSQEAIRDAYIKLNFIHNNNDHKNTINKIYYNLWKALFVKQENVKERMELVKIFSPMDAPLYYEEIIATLHGDTTHQIKVMKQRIDNMLGDTRDFNSDYISFRQTNLKNYLSYRNHEELRERIWMHIALKKSKILTSRFIIDMLDIYWDLWIYTKKNLYSFIKWNELHGYSYRDEYFWKEEEYRGEYKKIIDEALKIVNDPQNNIFSAKYEFYQRARKVADTYWLIDEKTQIAHLVCGQMWKKESYDKYYDPYIECCIYLDKKDELTEYVQKIVTDFMDRVDTNQIEYEEIYYILKHSNKLSTLAYLKDTIKSLYDRIIKIVPMIISRISHPPKILEICTILFLYKDQEHSIALLKACIKKNGQKDILDSQIIDIADKNWIETAQLRHEVMLKNIKEKNFLNAYHIACKLWNQDMQSMLATILKHNVLTLDDIDDLNGFSSIW